MKKFLSIVGITLCFALAGFIGIAKVHAFGFLNNPSCTYRDIRGQCQQYNYLPRNYPTNNFSSFYGSPYATYQQPRLQRLNPAPSVVQSPWDNRYINRFNSNPWNTYRYDRNYEYGDGDHDDDSFYDDDDKNYYDDDDGYDTNYDDDDYYYYDDDDQYRDRHARDPQIEYENIQYYCFGNDCSRPYQWR